MGFAPNLFFMHILPSSRSMQNLGYVGLFFGLIFGQKKSEIAKNCTFRPFSRKVTMRLAPNFIFRLILPSFGSMQNIGQVGLFLGLIFGLNKSKIALFGHFLEKFPWHLHQIWFLGLFCLALQVCKI